MGAGGFVVWWLLLEKLVADDAFVVWQLFGGIVVSVSWMVWRLLVAAFFPLTHPGGKPNQRTLEAVKVSEKKKMMRMEKKTARMMFGGMIWELVLFFFCQHTHTGSLADYSWVSILT